MTEYHELKCKNPYFTHLWLGTKTVEVREYAAQDDRPRRDFKVGDVLRVKELDGKRQLDLLITHILWDHEGYGLKDGWCAISFERLS